MLVLGGAVLGFIPQLPEVRLDPEVVRVVFLPPLLYGASIFANSGYLRANLRGLTLNAVDLVPATMCAVACTAHALVPSRGFPCPALIRRLGVSDGGADADEEIHARLVATEAVLAELDPLAGEEWTREETVERLRRFYEYRRRRFAARAGKIEADGDEGQTLAYQQTLQRLLGAQGEALLRGRDDGGLSNEVMNRVLHELDLEESRLEI